MAYVVRRASSYWHKEDLEPGNHIELPIGEALALERDGWLGGFCENCSSNFSEYVFHPVKGKHLSDISLEVMSRRLNKGRNKVTTSEKLKPGTRVRFKYHKSPGGRMLTNMVGTVTFHEVDKTLTIRLDALGEVVEYDGRDDIEGALKELEVMYI